MGTGERCVVCDWRAPDHEVGCSAAACRGATLILAERKRQVQVEGWTPEHDDGYRRGELVDAARAYAAVYKMSPALAHQVVFQGDLIWPWDLEWWKPSDDPIKNLVRAGALIAAEIDRLQRAGVSSADVPCAPDHAESAGIGPELSAPAGRGRDG